VPPCIVFRILGPLEAEVDGTLVETGAEQLRRLLCLLLLDPGRPVSNDSLVISLWPQEGTAPREPLATLRTYASRLRRLLPEGVGPQAEGHGYRLEIKGAEIDATRFEELVAAAEVPSADNARQVALTLRQAVGLWRGQALGEFRDETWALGTAVRLEELRLVALERLADARLLLGEHVELCGDLERLVDEYPLRERLWAQLMTAQYRSGRQADALRSYRRLREHLVEGLGIEPSPELAELEAAVLRHDATLAVGSAAPSTTLRDIDTGSHAFLVFAVADVRGYSSYADQRGDEAAAALAQHFIDVATEVLAANGGELVATRGDEVVAVFHSPRSALRASLAMQRRFVNETTKDPELPLPVGIGLDMGEVVVTPDGYLGNAINVAARLCAIAPAGAILATREVVHVAQALEDVRYELRTPVSLKGIAEPVHHARVVDEAEDTVAAYVRLGRTQAAPPPPRRRALPKRRLVLPVVLAVLAVTAILVAVNVNGSSPPLAILPDGVSAFNSSGAVLESMHVAGDPAGIAGGFGSEWVTSTSTDQVLRVAWSTGAVTPIQVGSQPEGIAVGAGAVWVADSADGTVDRINPLNNAVVATVAVSAGPDDLAYFDGSIWVSDSLAATVSEIDPANDGVKTISTGPEPAGIAGGDGSLWVADEGSASVQTFDPATGAPGPQYSVGNGPTALAYGDGAAWVANSLDGTLSRIDANDDSVTTSPAGAGSDSVAVADGRVWVGNEDADTLSEYSSSGLPLQTIPAGSAPSAIDFSDRRFWLASDGLGAAAHRGGVLVVDTPTMWVNLSEQPENPPVIDPGYADDPPLWRILIMTNDGLVGFRRVGGLQGGGLVPDLATFLPSPTQKGLTYTFHLRPGIRYSNGQPVVASDFRYALERAVMVSDEIGEQFGSGVTTGPVGFFTSALVGGPQCVNEPKTCSFAQAVQTDNQTGTVVFHLVHPDPDFLYQLALPVADAVPIGTPAVLPAGGSVPATGPYKILSYRPSGGDSTVVLVRNPYFHLWSAAAQPEGFPDRIVINTHTSCPSQAVSCYLPIEVKSVEDGTADAMWDQPTSSQYNYFKENYPGQVFAMSLLWGGTVHREAFQEGQGNRFYDAGRRRAVRSEVAGQVHHLRAYVQARLRSLRAAQ